MAPRLPAALLASLLALASGCAASWPPPDPPRDPNAPPLPTLTYLRTECFACEPPVALIRAVLTNDTSVEWQYLAPGGGVQLDIWSDSHWAPSPFEIGVPRESKWLTISPGVTQELFAAGELESVSRCGVPMRPADVARSGEPFVVYSESFRTPDRAGCVPITRTIDILPIE